MVLGLNQGKYQITDDFAISNVSGIDILNPKTGLGVSAVRLVSVIAPTGLLADPLTKVVLNGHRDYARCRGATIY